jgi:hypothetical protein
LRSRLQTEQALEEAQQALLQERRAIAINLLKEGVDGGAIARTTGLTMAQVEGLQGLD